MIFSFLENTPKPIVPEIKLNEVIKEIENTDLLLPDQKMELLLVVLGLKPRMAFFSFIIDGDQADIDYEAGEIFNSIKSLHRYINFYVHPHINQANGTRLVIEISPVNQKTNIFDLSDTNKDHYKIGVELGYPKTSARAFGTSEKVNKGDLQLSDEQKKFLYFSLSKKHYKSELNFLQKQIEAVKKYSPKIYEQVMKSE